MLNCAPATGLQTWTMIRTCNIKALGFQRLSFTANFRSPGSYASRQLIKGCFHPHLPIQHPRSSLTTTGLLLSEIPWYDVWISLHRMGHFETIEEKMLSSNSAVWPCSSRGLIRGYLGPLFEERTPVFPHPMQLIHLGELAPGSLRLHFNGVNMNITVNCGSLVHVEDCGLLFQ